MHFRNANHAKAECIPTMLSEYFQQQGGGSGNFTFLTVLAFDARAASSSPVRDETGEHCFGFAMLPLNLSCLDQLLHIHLHPHGKMDKQVDDIYGQIMAICPLQRFRIVASVTVTRT
jgi:hypothetical protein